MRSGRRCRCFCCRPARASPRSEDVSGNHLSPMVQRFWEVSDLVAPLEAAESKGRVTSDREYSYNLAVDDSLMRALLAIQVALLIVATVPFAPSIIVYTPTGHVAVHFVPGGRKAFVADRPTGEEARAAVTGYVSYFGAYGLYPGEWLHHYLLVSIAPANAGDTFRSVLRLSEPTATLTFRQPCLTASRSEIACL